MSALRRRWRVFARDAKRRGMSLTLPQRQRLLWSLRRGLYLLGRPGLLAVGLLLSLPLFYLVAVAPAQARLGAAHSGSLSLQEQIRHASRALDGEILRTPNQQLAAFYRIIPQQNAAPQWLKKLVALAHKHGLRLNEGEYKALPDKAGRLMRLQMEMPVQGDYRQIRRFLAAMPGEIPIIALEHVQFTRQNVADPRVEARLRLALYLEQGS